MIVISAFPGCGKTTFVKDNPQVLDMDSSGFDKADFPANYIGALRERMGKGEVTLISTHRAVREALKQTGVHFTLIYPLHSCKDEYLWRYLNREGLNGGEAFASLLDNHWDTWVNECEHQTGAMHLRLGHGQYLSDAIQLGDNGVQLKAGFETALRPSVV